MAYDPATSQVTLFATNDEITKVMRQNRREMAEAMHHYLSKHSKILAASYDKINWQADWPASYRDTTATTLLLQGRHETTPTRNLAAIAQSSAVTAFCTAHFLPHGTETLETTRALKYAADFRTLQRDQGESDARVKAMSTKCVCASSIRSADNIVSGCANQTTFCRAVVDFDVTSNDITQVPFLHHVARSLAEALTSRYFRDFQKTNPKPELPWYWMMHLWDRIHCTYNNVLNCEDSIEAASPANGSSRSGEIEVEHVKNAHAALKRGLETFQAACSGAMDFDEVQLYRSSPFSEASKTKRINEAAAKLHGKRDPTATPKDRKRPKLAATPQGDATPTREKHPGPIIVTPSRAKQTTGKGNYLLHVPDPPPGEKRLCPAALRHNTRGGCTTQGCDKNHDPPHLWSEATWAILKPWVQSKEELEWNPDICTPELMGLKLSRTPTEKVDTP
jgi:hypothetical protein